jgi:hypothetical protein
VRACDEFFGERWRATVRTIDSDVRLQPSSSMASDLAVHDSRSLQLSDKAVSAMTMVLLAPVSTESSCGR